MITLKTYFLIGMFFVSFMILAQFKIEGKVINENDKIIPNAKIVLNGSTLIAETTKQGTFIFTGISRGFYTLLISATGYEVFTFSFNLKKSVQLPPFQLKKSVDELLILEDSELDSEEGNNTSVAFLQASQDIFQQTAAFQWGGFFFKPRGYNLDKNKILFNGIIMNKAQNGEPLWRNWGGLNDVTRYPSELKYGLNSSEKTLGSTGGITSFSVQASNFAKGGRISSALTNYSYTQRLMATYATGLKPNGWAFVTSGSRRWSEEGIIDGTFYDSWAYFLAVEKQFNNQHHLNLTTFGAPYRRSGNSPNTQEVYDLEGIHYNAYWGWQDGKQRVERVRNTYEPIWILSHYWKPLENTSLKTTISYQYGKNSYTRLDRGDDQLTQSGYQDFLNNPIHFNPKTHYNFVSSPSPIYYRYLPSYFNSKDRKEYDKINWDNSDQYAGPVLNRQINWAFLYQTNYWNSIAGLGAAYFLVEDVNQDQIFNTHTHFQTQLSNHITFNGAMSYQHTRSKNYRLMKDLLGGLPIKNLDFFKEYHFNILDKKRKVKEGERFNYNYDLFQYKINAYGLWRFSYNLFDYELGVDYTRTTFWRKGNYQNEYNLEHSFGKSTKHSFDDFGIKAHILYKMNGKHFFKLNSLYQRVAPVLNDAFVNIRYLNTVLGSIKSNQIFSGDFNYIHRGKNLKAKLSTYWTEMKDQTSVQTYYLDDDGDATGFLYQSLYGMNTRHLGVELGIEYPISSTLIAKSALSIGQFTYTNNPSVVTYRDGIILENELLKTVYYNGYKIPGSPQRAYNLGLEYRSPHYWWLSLNGNLLSHHYASLNPGKHSDVFIVSAPPDSQEFIDKLLHQERFSSEFFINLSIGKSWRVHKNNILASLNINNLLNNTQIKTGGFEQGYLGSYDKAFKESHQTNPKWGNRYWYQQGVSFFANIIYKF